MIKPSDLRTGFGLTARDRLELRPNELGNIPIFMYHVIAIDKPEDDDGYTRTVAEFKAELATLHERGYYVVPLKDVIANRIAAPAGKHPVVLTFDDATAGHFRYIPAANGFMTIDPNSAIGIMEAFFAEHLDFGRGGYFAVPSKTCFIGKWARPNRIRPSSAVKS